jgi:hypothetical protein
VNLRSASFNANGALSIEDPAYVERQFEREMLRQLSANQWVSLLGPRKAGKSSALMRVRSDLVATGFSCAFVDLQRYGMPDADYARFLHWFVEIVADELKVHVTPPRKRRHRRQLDSWLREVITSEHPNTAILVDEASAVPEGFREPFFSQLRALYNSRARIDSADGEVAARIVFAFAGTFRPNQMIDNANSPFNVSFEINPDDLTQEEVGALADLGLGDEAAIYAQRAFEDTRGQPYYVQHLFAAVQANNEGPAERAEAFDRALEQLRRGAHGHLEDLTGLVDRDEDLRALIPGILDGGLLFQAGNPAHNYATIAGVAREEQGCLVPRNPIYARALARFGEERFP